LGVLHARRLLHRDLSPRNLLRTPSGRLKLIDFGALASFGPNPDLVGTPPFVPPEALRGEPLDQRSDLFALGALGYWLITGIHAFPARHLRDLERLHQSTPALPSSLLSLLTKPEDEPVPPELDALLLALLRTDLTARPNSTAELIDRLNAIAELEHEAAAPSVQGYLDSKVFVGRERERERVLELLAEARLGRVRALLLESAPGLGRTRLLQGLAVDGRLAGASVITLAASRDERPFAAAGALASALLNALPNEAREAAQPYAAELALLGPELAARLGSRSPSLREGPHAEQRVRLHHALRDWVASLAQGRLLAVYIDDIHAIDEESRALLAMLAHLEGHTKLLLVGSAEGSSAQAGSAALQSFRTVAVRLALLPLTAPETLALLRSVFGAAPFLERTAERLFRVSGGDPSYCLELAQHLIRENLARYMDGSWALPADLDALALPGSRTDAQVARLTQLSLEARRLAQALSIPHHGALSATECAQLADQPERETLPLLHELTRTGVLRETTDGYELVHEAVRALLDSELSEPRRSHAQLQLGELRLATAQGDRVALLRASLHLFRGGQIQRSLAVMRRAGERQTYESLRLTARLFEEAYQLMRAHGLGPHARATALSTLSLSSYHVDRRYARYADDALVTFDQVLHLSLARRLSPFLGGKLSLICALLVSGVARLPHRAYAPSVRQLVSLCMRAFVALTGTAGCCVDPESGRRYADVLKPFIALGPDHGAALASTMALLFVQGTEDRPAHAVAGLRAMVAKIELNEPVREVTPEIRMEALAGCLFVLGINCSWRDDPEALQIADRLDNFSPLYAMTADHLRSNYHAAQGNGERAEHFRKRVELHAVQLGNTWQVETWAPADAIKTALRTNDALLAKRAAESLAMAASEVPSLAREERHARGTYLMLRGKFDKAIPLLSQEFEPQSFAGWARVRGSLARCYNGLGQHERARGICLDVMARLTPEDLAYALHNLNVQIELALAEAALGRFAEARAELDRMFQQHVHNRGALTMGAIHEARCKVALREGDLTTACEQLAHMDAWYRPTGIGLLRDLVDVLQRELNVAGKPRGHHASGHFLGIEPSEQLHSRVHLLLTRDGGHTLAERAQRSLQLALEVSSARTGFLVFDGEEAAVTWGAEEPPTALTDWACEALEACSMDEQTEIGSDFTSAHDAHSRSLDRTHYVFIPLWAGSSHDKPTAGLVLGFDGALRRVPDPVVLQSLALHLQRVDHEA
ncbi:MAG: Protein kinase, partial [Myxococcaceae bacterium]|nr:Protein kinase [Myxococcaceae bacterium]